MHWIRTRTGPASGLRKSFTWVPVQIRIRNLWTRWDILMSESSTGFDQKNFESVPFSPSPGFAKSLHPTDSGANLLLCIISIFARRESSNLCSLSSLAKTFAFCLKNRITSLSFSQHKFLRLLLLSFVYAHLPILLIIVMMLLSFLIGKTATTIQGNDLLVNHEL